MSLNLVPSRKRQRIGVLIRSGSLCLAVVLSVSLSLSAQSSSDKDKSAAGSAIHVTHILGFGSAKHNAKGALVIQHDALQFRQGEGTGEEVSLPSIQNVSIGQEDRQVGGVPLMVGKAAVPFGGGRVVSLFSHKKYDSLTIEYLDKDGGFHGAVFRLTKGQGQILEQELIADGVHIMPQDQSKTPSTPEVKDEN